MAGEDFILRVTNGIPLVETIEDNMGTYNNLSGSVAVGDAVSFNPLVDSRIDIANSSNASDRPPIGVVAEILSPTSCIVMHFGGTVSGLVGLTRGASYWLTNSGTSGNTITDLEPVTDRYIIGVATSSTRLLVAAVPANIEAGIGGAGDVIGPASSSDNAIVRYDGTTGKIIQDSSVSITNAGNVELGSTGTKVNWSVDTFLQGGTGVDDTILSAAQDLIIKADEEVVIRAEAGDVTIEPGNIEKASFQSSGGLKLKEQALQPPTGAGEGSIWVKNESPSSLYFTDESGNDWLINKETGDVTGPVTSANNSIAIFSDTTGKIIADSEVLISSGNKISNLNSLSFLETTSSSITGVGGTGTFWVRNDSSTSPMFTDDSNVDHNLLGNNRDKVIYVGKHGNNANSGLTMDQAKLTLSGADTAVAAQSPSAANIWTIRVLDAGVYSGDLDMTDYVNLYAPDATFNTTLSPGINSSVVVNKVVVSSGIAMVLAGAGDFWIKANHIENTSNGNAFSISSTGRTDLTIGTIKVGKGRGVNVSSASLGTNVNISKITVTGTGAGLVYNVTTANHTGFIGEIKCDGAGTAISLSNSGMHVSLHVGLIDCATTWAVGLSSTLDMFVGSVTGSPGTVLGGANIVEADLASGPAGVSGTGIANRMTRWSNGTTIENSSFLESGSSLLPIANGSQNLGSAAFQWNNIYLDNSLISSGPLSINAAAALTLDSVGGVSFENSGIEWLTLSGATDSLTFTNSGLISGSGLTIESGSDVNINPLNDVVISANSVNWLTFDSSENSIVFDNPSQIIAPSITLNSAGIIDLDAATDVIISTNSVEWLRFDSSRDSIVFDDPGRIAAPSLTLDSAGLIDLDAATDIVLSTNSAEWARFDSSLNKLQFTSAATIQADGVEAISINSDATTIRSSGTLDYIKLDNSNSSFVANIGDYLGGTLPGGVLTISEGLMLMGTTPDSANAGSSAEILLVGGGLLHGFSIRIADSGATIGSMSYSKQSSGEVFASFDADRFDFINATPSEGIRIRNSYTPTGSADPNGSIGTIVWDANYIYCKVNSGTGTWGRVALDFAF